MLNVVGFRCAVCAATVDVATPLPWRCPRAVGGDRHHVLQIVRRMAPLRGVDDPNPFVRYDVELAWAAFAEANGMTAEARTALVRELDDAVSAIDGTGFRVTPFERSAELSTELGFSADGGVWVKDETGNVAGSHKARHLFTVLLHLRAAELLRLAPWSASSASSSSSERPALAIASCGNAALAAATLARAADWPIEVFVPDWADAVVVARLAELGARITTCERRAGDLPGDPTVLRFREAVDAGAVPFSVQGPENALCLDGGRTIGWEMNEVLDHMLDRVFVQVGGGAFAACVGAAFRAAGVHPIIHAVQADGCAPLALAWDRSSGDEHPERRWAEIMTPWPGPRSVADGILDDETYDWIGVFDAMRDCGGTPVVASEDLIVRAHQLASSTGIHISPTGSAGLAGLMSVRDQVDDGERVAVIFSGVGR
jgi:threonine dehydratase